MDISPKFPVFTFEEEVVLPITFSETTSQLVGGWRADSQQLSAGKVKIQANAERILIGNATEPLTGVGIFIGKDGSDYEFRAGDPSGNYFHYDGTNITVKGATITAGSINIGSGNAVINSSGFATFISQSDLNVKTYTVFEDAGRFFSAVAGTGVTTFFSTGVLIDCGADANSYARIIFRAFPDFGTDIATVTSTIQMRGSVDTGSGDGDMFVGVGTPTIAVSGHTWTVDHMGFKMVKISGVTTLYATQADGSTENESSALVVLGNDDKLDLMMKITDGVGVDYYYRLNAGNLIKITLTSNMPSNSAVGTWSGSVTSQSAEQFGLNPYSVAIER